MAHSSTVAVTKIIISLRNLYIGIHSVGRVRDYAGNATAVLEYYIVKMYPSWDFANNINQVEIVTTKKTLQFSFSTFIFRFSLC